MSAETAQAVKDAEAALERASAEARRVKEATLAQIAEQLPERVNAMAKRQAHAQPDVTKALGKDGVAQMRAELAAEAKALGDRFVAAIDDIEWPTSSGIRAHNVHTALFNHFYRRVDGPADILEKHGYDLHGEYKSATDAVVLPQELYDQNSFDPLAAALIELGHAEQALTQARRADDRSAVEDLWD